MKNFLLCTPGWKAEVSPLGAELQSLIRESDQEEFIWQGNSTIWSGRAPILFPVIGRLKNEQIIVDGRTWPLTKHGFARDSEFTLVSQSNNSLTLELRANDTTQALYPYDFCLQVSFDLRPGTLAVSYKVINTGQTSLYFSIGSHPAFRLPLQENTLEDYYLEFSEKETLDRYILHHGLMPENGIPFLNNESRIGLTSTLFDQDALIFRNIRSHKISLNHKSTGERLSLMTGGAPHLGLWAKPGAAFICIEPWFGFDDPVNASGKIEEKPGMIRLPAGANFQTGIGIKIV